MKGIVLAGGYGTRLHPVTQSVSKQLLPIYDKPMVYYPISMLMLSDIRDILIISTPQDLILYRELLGSGSQFGVTFSYCVQEAPKGLAQAFLLGEEFIGDENVCLVLGDNVFYGAGLPERLINARKKVESSNSAVIFGYKVKDPERYGVAEFDGNGRVVGIEEKPEFPKSSFAVVGLYYYSNDVIDIAKKIKPSSRGELEITSVNQAFLEINRLNIELMGRGYAWLDTGTFEAMTEASQFIHALEKRQGMKVSCLEEIACIKKWISSQQLIDYLETKGGSEYYDYLRQWLN
ncbi:MAG: glucose-1-phosphate thymidylyltransferase [Candidatus Marinimicrobia bacterium]|nr:glucose-1-phosphate thymidylyltransferase [Candidatus Neomarinimicrobiota bacterium]|tara:strand:+ start:28595 stop:29467 length:873 start_codon:yes stop_codon:yes gene_type:complete